MSNFCIECRFYRGCDVDGKTPVCHNFIPFGKTILFDRLISSPEVLAEKLVYITVTAWGETVYISTIIRDGMFKTREEAIAATVARLKEVCNG